MTTQPSKRFRLIVDFKAQFPEKLYDVANDGYLVHWTNTGSVSISSEEEFEQSVMKLYPGFLQIPSFLNFKRLCREYGFGRIYNDRGEPEFSHPMFIRGRRDLLCEIKTKRKSMRSPRRMCFEDDVIPAEYGKRYSRRRRNKPRRFKAGNISINSNDSSNDSSDIQLNKSSNNSTDIMNTYASRALEPSDTESGRDHVSQTLSTKIINVHDQQYVIDVINDYAENEFNEEEYTKWLAEQRKKDEMKSLVEKKVVNRTQEFWWMYSDKNEQVETIPPPTENGSTSVIMQAGTTTGEAPAPKVEETCMPCGFCKCCSAISNYVHIFGEVPENIQVFDFLQEAQTESS